MVTELGRELKKIPHFRNVNCRKCGMANPAHALDMYLNCSSCGTRMKLRSFSAEIEFLDIVDDVLEWAKTDEAWKALERRRQQIREPPWQEDDN